MLTIFLIIQELNKFFIIKPTGTSKEEKRLRASDLPEVVLCVDPPFDAEALAGYGYLDDTTNNKIFITIYEWFVSERHVKEFYIKKIRTLLSDLI